MARNKAQCVARSCSGNALRKKRALGSVGHGEGCGHAESPALNRAAPRGFICPEARGAIHFSSSEGRTTMSFCTTQVSSLSTASTSPEVRPLMRRRRAKNWVHSDNEAGWRPRTIRYSKLVVILEGDCTEIGDSFVCLRNQWTACMTNELSTSVVQYHHILTKSESVTSSSSSNELQRRANGRSEQILYLAQSMRELAHATKVLSFTKERNALGNVVL